MGKREEELAKKLEEYQNLAKENKNIDVAQLMIAAMQNQESNLLSSRQKNLAYMVSFFFPPFGLFFALKFWLSDKEDANHAALVCVLLTVLSGWITYMFLKSFTQNLAPSIQQNIDLFTF